MLFLRVSFDALLDQFRSRRRLVLENALLRYQVGVLKRRRARFLVRGWDRPILVWLTKRIQNWRELFHLFQPETLINWHRKGFRLYWYWRFASRAGRPKTSPETICLIQQMALTNPRWGAPRIHGELLKLGIKLAQSTVENYIRLARRGRPSPQKWKTFLKNHVKELVAIDFLIVPTLRFKLLWVLVVLSHDRREILHFAVTKRPSASWTAQQLRNLYPFQDFPKILLHDRDRNFWGLSKFGFREMITAHCCPWQNGYVERLNGTIRRECTDHLIALNERQLSRVLNSYKDYYNQSRTHLALNKDSPVTRPIEKYGEIKVRSRVGGLHHEFRREAA